MIPRSQVRWPYPSQDNKRCYVVILLLQDMVARIDPNHSWKATFAKFMAERSEMELIGLHAPKTWRNVQPWRAILAPPEA